MSDKQYLRPKVTQSNGKNVKRIQGMFVNVDSYPELGGFTSANKLDKGNPSLALEKGGPQVQKGKPI